MPVYLRQRWAGETILAGAKTVFTIHNLAYQGLFPQDRYPLLGLDRSYYCIDGLEYYGQIDKLRVFFNHPGFLEATEDRLKEALVRIPSNIAEVRRRVAAGTLRVVWQSEVASLAPGRATLATPTGSLIVPCDAVFVLIGAIPAEGLLRDAGLLAAG